MLLELAATPTTCETDMRVICRECGKPATITHRKSLCDDVADLYCSCSDSECGHTFVASLSFKHTLSPSRKQASDMLANMFAKLSSADQKAIIEQAQLSL